MYFTLATLYYHSSVLTIFLGHHIDTDISHYVCGTYSQQFQSSCAFVTVTAVLIFCDRDFLCPLDTASSTRTNITQKQQQQQQQTTTPTTTTTIADCYLLINIF